MKRMQLPSAHCQKGLSLMESMIAMVVLSVGLLGIAGMQLSALKASNSANYRAIASIKASELADRMRANLGGVYAGDYLTNTAWDCTAPPTSCVGVSAGSSCTIAQMAAFDLYQASCVNGITDLLPNGSLSITCTDTDTGDSDPCSVGSESIITIRWQSNADAQENANQVSQLVMSVVLGFSEN